MNSQHQLSCAGDKQSPRLSMRSVISALAITVVCAYVLIQPLAAVKDKKLPIVYRPEYDVDVDVSSFLPNMDHFDAQKWGGAIGILRKQNVLAGDGEDVFKPSQVPASLLERYLSADYLKALKDPETIAKIFDPEAFKSQPMSFWEKFVMKPQRYHTGGTLLATSLALKHGAAVNVGGGWNRASLGSGGQLCVYPDITLAVLEARRKYKVSGDILIVDLDAFHGTGYATDFAHDKNVTIVSFSSFDADPKDAAIARIDRMFKIHYAPVQTYLDKVDEVLSKLSKQPFSLLVYLAGSEAFGTPWMGYNAEQFFVDRDERVFKFARYRGIPIVMTTAGGFGRLAASAIAKSIHNLIAKRYLKAI